MTFPCVMRFNVAGFCVCVKNCRLLHDHISLCGEVYCWRLCVCDKLQVTP